MSRFRNAILTAILGTGLITAGSGCTEALVASHAASYVGGFLTASTMFTGNADLACFRNGTPIDCADLPAGLAPTAN